MRGVEGARQGQRQWWCNEGMMVAMSVRWSEGKTMASGGCGSEFRQGCVCVLRTTKGCNRVQARREWGKRKRN